VGGLADVHGARGVLAFEQQEARVHGAAVEVVQHAVVDRVPARVGVEVDATVQAGVRDADDGGGSCAHDAVPPKWERAHAFHRSVMLGNNRALDRHQAQPSAWARRSADAWVR
jgi:hypothetical protein